jgi:N-acylneuraminate cytidylyltransferase
MNAAIIPAKGTSTRIPGKNKRDFHGKPIIAWSILTAIASGLFETIHVSTDDDEIGDIALRYGAGIIRRPPELSEVGVPDCGTQEVIRHAILQFGTIPAYVCGIYPTAPLMRPEDLIRGWQAITSNEHSPFAYSVGWPLADAGQFYWGRAQAFIDRTPLQSDDSLKILISSDRVCDINTEDDWSRAETMFNLLHGGVDA